MRVLHPAAEVVGFGRDVVSVARDENMTFMAGGLAYYAFVSLVPLGALLFLALAAVGDESFAERVLRLTGSMLSPSASGLLRSHIVGGAVSGTVGASVVGLVTLLWSSLKLFRGLDTAFSEVYETAGDDSFLGTLTDGVVALVTVPVALCVVVVVTTLLSVGVLDGVRLMAPVTLVGGLMFAFLPLYYVFPDADVSVREVLPGVAVAAVGWVALQQLFHVYVVLAGSSTGGVVGAVVLFLTWLYFAGVVLLLGGVVNAVHGGHRRELPQRGGEVGERRPPVVQSDDD
jgi:membrane protein